MLTNRRYGRSGCMQKLLYLSEQLRQDVAYGVRTLWRAPGFSFTAISVLAIGIGATLAMLHLFNAAVYHRLSIRDADSLIHFQPAMAYPMAAFYRRARSRVVLIHRGGMGRWCFCR